MNDEEKRKILEANGYHFYVNTAPDKRSHVKTPDDWHFFVDDWRTFESDNFPDDYENKVWQLLLDKAWRYYQQQLTLKQIREAGMLQIDEDEIPPDYRPDYRQAKGILAVDLNIPDLSHLPDTERFIALAKRLGAPRAVDTIGWSLADKKWFEAQFEE